MLFNSWEFLVLLVLTYGLYYFSPWSGGRHGKAWQVTLLLAASTIFYGWEDPRLLLLLGVSCVGNSIATAKIILFKSQGDEASAKRWVRLAVILNLALLVVFKYAGFLAGLVPGLPVSWVAAMKAIPLPVGISFYTFHGISMIVDVWRGEVTRESDDMLSRGKRFAKGVRDIGFYLMFFPQLVAGPIVKAKQFWPQIAAKLHGDVRWGVVVRSLIAGYFLKMVVADNLAEQTGLLTQPALASMGAFELIPLLYGYSLQIFADFAGYSLIALGLAAMFGYQFPDNFNFPYLSTSLTEFWRRWHLSLSSWLRDYLYIPLGGNRKGEARTYLNLFIVMFLGGIWHGAEWKFALWGSLHGLLLGVERFWFRGRERTVSSWWMRVAGWVYCFQVVTLLWLTFLMPDMHHIRLFFEGLGRIDGARGPVLYTVAVFGGAVLLYHAAGWLKEHRQKWFSRFRGSWTEGVCYGLMLFLIVTNSGAPQGFIYFQF